MLNLAQRTLELVKAGDGLTDREIADRLFAPGAAQQERLEVGPGLAITYLLQCKTRLDPNLDFP